MSKNMAEADSKSIILKKTKQYKSATWNYLGFEVQQGNGNEEVIEEQIICKTCKTKLW